jgi:hypothetical protein
VHWGAEKRQRQGTAGTAGKRPAGAAAVAGEASLGFSLPPSAVQHTAGPRAELRLPLSWPGSSFPWSLGPLSQSSPASPSSPAPQSCVLLLKAQTDLSPSTPLRPRAAEAGSWESSLVRSLGFQLPRSETRDCALKTQTPLMTAISQTGQLSFLWWVQHHGQSPETRPC